MNTMERFQDKKIGVISLRRYGGKHDFRFEMESTYLGFSIFKSISCCEEELDPELVREWWLRSGFGPM